MANAREGQKPVPEQKQQTKAEKDFLISMSFFKEEPKSDPLAKKESYMDDIMGLFGAGGEGGAKGGGAKADGRNGGQQDPFSALYVLPGNEGRKGDGSGEGGANKRMNEMGVVGGDVKMLAANDNKSGNENEKKPREVEKDMRRINGGVLNSEEDNGFRVMKYLSQTPDSFIEMVEKNDVARLRNNKCAYCDTRLYPADTEGKYYVSFCFLF
jgi:hypothetical protein